MYQKTRFDNTAENVVVSYVLVIGMFTVLSALLISAAGGYLDTKQESVTEVQGEITVEAIAAEIQEVDKHARKIDSSKASAGFITYNSQTDKLIGQYPYKVQLLPTATPDKYTVQISVQTAEIDVVETTNITLTEIDTVETGKVITGSTLAVEYTRNGELRLVEDTRQYAVNQTSNYNIPDDSITNGGIRTDGDLDGGNNAYIYGPVFAGGSIDFSDDLTVAGDVTGGLDIQVDDDNIVTGTVVSTSGQVTIRDRAEIGNDVQASGDVALEQDATVGGSISSGGQVVLGTDTVVRGDVTVNDEFDLICGTNATINGQQCSTYKSNNY